MTMKPMTNRQDFLVGWRSLVEEIAEIEELIADAEKPGDTHSLWSLHLLNSALKLKRQQLDRYLRQPHHNA